MDNGWPRALLICGSKRRPRWFWAVVVLGTKDLLFLLVSVWLGTVVVVVVLVGGRFPCLLLLLEVVIVTPTAPPCTAAGGGGLRKRLMRG